MAMQPTAFDLSNLWCNANEWLLPQVPWAHVCSQTFNERWVLFFGGWKKLNAVVHTRTCLKKWCVAHSCNSVISSATQVQQLFAVANDHMNLVVMAKLTILTECIFKNSQCSEFKNGAHKMCHLPWLRKFWWMQIQLIVPRHEQCAHCWWVWLWFCQQEIVSMVRKKWEDFCYLGRNCWDIVRRI